MARNPYMTGVGGWLWLLVFQLTFLNPFLGLGRQLVEFRTIEEQFPMLATNENWQNFKQITWLIFAESASISIAAG